MLGVVGPEIRLPLGWSAGSECDTAGLLSLNAALLCKKEQERRRVEGASPVAAPMPKSVPH